MPIRLNENTPAITRDPVDAGGHWYSVTEGEVVPLYKDGCTFTLREARALAKAGQIVLPSVTTIFKCMHKGGLQNWLVEQALTAALKLDRRDYGSDREWMDACMNRSDAIAGSAADLGTKVHGAIERWLRDGEIDADLQCYVGPAADAIEDLGIRVDHMERCVANLREGYAGRVDCEGTLADGTPVVLDFKTRTSLKGYDTDAMQVAAYGVAIHGLKFLVAGRGYNIVIGTRDVGKVKVIEHRGETLSKAYAAFVGLCAVWRFSNDFDPRVLK